MSGLVKPKQYDWKDSNLAMFGSDEEKKLKKSAAMKEPAWTGCENFEGTKIWRIEKFKVKDWPKSEYGKFFDGDSYIILHSEKDPDSNELDFDVHFWIGGSSTQDEYGAAAYKTLELDTYLDDKAVQHREVGGKESEEFLGYFGGKITIEEGGIDSGFNHVVPSEERLPFTRNLLKHFKKIPNKEGKMEYHAVDMPYTQKNLCCDDGYVVIFSEDKMYQVKGKNAKIDSICPFNEWMSVQKHEHPRAKLQVYESLNELFGTEVYKNAPADFVVKLIRVLTDKSKAEFRVVAEGIENISEDLLDSDDVFLLEAPDRLFVWIGKNASSREKQNALSYAQNYLKEQGQEPCCGVSCMREKDGKYPALWKRIITKQNTAEKREKRGAVGRRNHHL